MTNITLRSAKGSPLTNNEVDSNFSSLNDFKVEQTDSTGSAIIPSGTTAERDASPAAGMFRYNSQLSQFEGYISDWGPIGITNLTNSASGTALTINSSSGTGTSLPAATTTTWGVMTDEDKTKLDGIETSAKDDQTITAGTGLSGGGTGDVTIDHSNSITPGTVSEGGVTRTLGYGGTFNIPSVTYDSEGHITSTTTTTLTLPASDNTNTTYDLSVPTSTTAIRLSGSNSTNDDVTITGGTNVTVTRNSATQLTISSTDTNTTYSAGTGIGLTGTTFSLDFSELTDMTADISATTEFILQNGTTESRKAASEIKLSAFNNDNSWTSNAGTVTSVGGTGTVSGLTLTGTVTSSGNLTLGGSLSGVTSSNFSSATSLIIYDSAGTPLKTIYSPGS